jgi:hypothetical protein
MVAFFDKNASKASLKVDSVVALRMEERWPSAQNLRGGRTIAMVKLVLSWCCACDLALRVGGTRFRSPLYTQGEAMIALIAAYFHSR